MTTKDNYIIITAYLDAICEENTTSTIEEFAQFFRSQCGAFPSLDEIEYFTYYAKLFNCFQFIDITK